MEKSTFAVSNRTITQTVGYSGVFRVDAATLDLLSLEFRAEDMNPGLTFCETLNRMEYAQLRINRVDFMLPSEAITSVIKDSGKRSTNVTKFTGCHQFLGESKLIFDEGSTATSTAAPGINQPLVEIPEGLTFDIALAQNIDPAVMSAGDTVQGKLAKPVEIPEQRVTLPAGTRVHGRIWMLGREYGQFSNLEFGVKWESLELGGKPQNLRLTLRSVTPLTAKTPDVTVKERAAAFREQDEATLEYLLFAFVKKTYQIPEGFETTWVSVKDAEAGNKPTK